MLPPCWWVGANHVNMARFAVLRVETTHCSCDYETPISSLRNILIVAKLQHQLVASLGVLCSCKTALLRTFAKAIVWQGRSNNVECRATRPGKKWQDVLNFNEGTRPWEYLANAFVIVHSTYSHGRIAMEWHS